MSFFRKCASFSVIRLLLRALILWTHFVWRIYEIKACLKLGRIRERGPHATALVTDGTWWLRPLPCIPYATPYFAAPEGHALASSLELSQGRDALLSSFRIKSGWLINSWEGLVMLSADKTADQEISSGSGGRLNIGWKVEFLRDSFVALQRNQSNYGHFLAEVAPSFLAFEKNLSEVSSITVGSEFGASVLRLAGFPQKISVVRPNSLVRVHNVEVLRMLPAGYLNAALMAELSSRVVSAVAGRGEGGREVVFLDRSDADNRRMVNSDEVVNVIKSRFPSVDIVVPAKLPLEQQVLRLVNARVVIAVRGSQGANLLWAKKLEHYIEISYNLDGYVSSIAEVRGAQLHRCKSTLVGENPDVMPSYQDHICDTDELRRLLSSL